MKDHVRPRVEYTRARAHTHTHTHTPHIIYIGEAGGGQGETKRTAAEEPRVERG